MHEEMTTEHLRDHQHDTATDHASETGLPFKALGRIAEAVNGLSMNNGP